MMYYSAAEYWFYVGVDEGLNPDYLERLLQFDTKAFNDSLEMYIEGCRYWTAELQYKEENHDRSQAV